MPDIDLEKYHFDMFLKAAHLDLSKVEKSETPDFLVEHNGSTVGIELMQFYWSPPPGQKPPQEIEWLVDFAIERARKLYRENNGEALYVNFHMGDCSTLNRRRAEKLGETLARMIFNHWPIPSLRRESNMEVEGIPEVLGYSIMKSIDGVDELWQGGSADWVVNVDPDEVQEAINKKIRVIENCHKKSERVWLVLINDFFRGGKPCELALEAQKSKYSFQAEKVYWLEVPSGKLFELENGVA